jgi:hypothetical protein
MPSTDHTTYDGATAAIKRGAMESALAAGEFAMAATATVTAASVRQEELLCVLSNLVKILHVRRYLTGFMFTSQRRSH